MAISNFFDPRPGQEAAQKAQEISWGDINAQEALKVSAQNRAMEAAKNLEAIQNARAEREKQRQLLDLEKKKMQIALDEQEMKSGLSSLARKQMEQQFNAQHSEAKKVMDAHDLLAEHAHDQYGNDLKNSVGMFTAITKAEQARQLPQPESPYQEQSFARPMAFNNEPMAMMDKRVLKPSSPVSAPTIPMGGAVSMKDDEYEKQMVYRPSKQEQGFTFDPAEMLKGNAVPVKREKYVPTTQEEALDYERKLRQAKGETLSPMQEMRKAKAVEGFVEEVETNRNMKSNIGKALESAEKLGSGGISKVKYDWMKLFDANNPILEDWQRVKSILTDTQLMYTAKTKGAISDREMDLFAKAAANDDLNSLPRIKAVLQSAIGKLNASEKAKAIAYQQNYKENPYEIVGGQEVEGQPTNENDPLGLR